jgi:hypothetical protein
VARALPAQVKVHPRLRVWQRALTNTGCADQFLELIPCLRDDLPVMMFMHSNWRRCRCLSSPTHAPGSGQIGHLGSIQSDRQAERFPKPNSNWKLTTRSAISITRYRHPRLVINSSDPAAEPHSFISYPNSPSSAPCHMCVSHQILRLEGSTAQSTGKALLPDSVLQNDYVYYSIPSPSTVVSRKKYQRDSKRNRPGQR